MKLYKSCNNNIEIHIDTYVPWKHEEIKGNKVWYAGDPIYLDKIINLISSDELNKNLINNYLSEQTDNFSLIVISDKRLFVAVDRIRAYPVYYSINNEKICVSNNARTNRSIFNLETLNEVGLLELTMSGYVTGDETLYEGLFQLQAGEFFIFENNHIDKNRYYRYIPCNYKTVNYDRDINALDDLINDIFSKITKRYKETQIWVPLSAGLDSRLVLAKLLENNAKNVNCFSYGVEGNFEAETARKICKSIGVPWHFMGGKLNESKSLYESEIRQKYSKGNDGLCFVPQYLDFQALYNLKNSNLLNNGAVIINGQSGDFITGGHIPDVLFATPTEEALYEHVVNKHYSLWQNILSQNNIDLIKKRIRKSINEIAAIGDYDIASIYEYWEWQERQCKVIVNSQRVYEYFDLLWEIPLWDNKLMDFFNVQPIECRYKQDLYKRYLKEKNPYNIFSENYPELDSWPQNKKWIKYIAFLIKLTRGKDAQAKFYEKMSFYNNYRNQFELFGKNYYLKNYKDARGVVSFSVDHWLNENGIENILR